MQPAQGYLYQLDDHLDRFYISAAKAALVPPFPRPQLRRIILETAAASQRFDGMSLLLTCSSSVWAPSYSGIYPFYLCPSLEVPDLKSEPRALLLNSDEKYMLFGYRIYSVLAWGWTGWIWDFTIGVSRAELLLHGVSQQGSARSYKGKQTCRPCEQDMLLWPRF